MTVETAAARPKARVLLVDDQRANRLALEAALEGLDVELIQASSGEDALRAVLQSDFAVILLDVQMPGLDGFETARIIRSREETRYTPIIFQTAHDTPRQTIELAYTLGAIDFLVKPVIPDVLRSKVCSFVDLYHQRRQILDSSEELRASEERFRLLVDGTRDYAIFMLDPEGNVASWNSGAERIEGYAASEIIGRHFSCFYRPEDIRAGKPAEELRIASTQGKYEEEGRRVRKDGSVYWASVVITALRDEHDRLRGFGKVLTDVTARRDAEENARKLIIEETARRTAEKYAQALDERRQELQNTLISIGDGVITTDREGRVTLLNPIAERLTGWTSNEAKGHSVEEVFVIVDEATGSPLENPVRRALAEGLAVGLPGRALLIARDGSKRPIDDSAAPTIDTSNRAFGCVLIFRDITERRRLEVMSSERMRTAQLLASIVESSDDAIVSKTLDGVIQTWNAGAERIFGYPSNEAVGKHISLIIPPDRLAEEDLIMRRLRAGERLEHFETLRLRKDGTLLNVSLTISPVRDETGRVIGASKIGRDISALKRAESQLRDSERTQRLLAEIGLLASEAELSDAGQIDRLLSAVCKRIASELGVSRCGLSRVSIETGTVVVEQDFHGSMASLKGSFTLSQENNHYVEDGKAGRTTILEDTAADPRTVSRYPDHLQAMAVRSYVSVPLHREGRWAASFWISDHVPRRWTSGELAMMESVAQRLWLAVEQARALLGRRESEERFRLMADAAPVMIWMSSPELGCTWFNTQWLEFVGRSMNQELGQGWRENIHPEDSERCREVHRRASEARTGFTVEFRLRRHDGQYRWLLDHGTPLFDMPYELTGYIGSCIDITDRKIAEETLREQLDNIKKAEQALQLADRRKDEFLATLAHELRNPLAPIRNAAAIIKNSGESSEVVLQAQTVIERQTGQLIHLVDDLLDVSRINEGKFHLRKERVELGAIVRSSLETARELIDANKHVLTIEIGPDPIFLDADPLRLAQVLSNLLHNAAKYTEPGGSIRLHAERKEDVVIISVRDNGIGIEREQLPHIFEIFSQTKPALERAHGGLGIGLSLVRGVVVLHGGSIEARSAGAGTGSEFIVRLPAAAPAADSAVAETGRGDQESSAPAFPRRILVVDDNRDAADSMAMILQLAGHEIRTAYDGAEALDAAGMFRPQVVLLDIGLPKMNGYEVAKSIREQPWGRDIVLVAQTGWGQETDKRRALSAGFNHHMTKPIDPVALDRLLLTLDTHGSNAWTGE